MTEPIFKNEIRVVPGPTDLSDDAELWRYMRLSTLLMLLRGKVFVPTIQELRRGDPVEARNLSVRTRSYFDDLSDIDRKWLLDHATKSELAIVDDPNTDSKQIARCFVAIWDRELAQRRRIWCWHQADIESMALWNIYAKEGVAVQTSPARIKDAFDPRLVDTALISRVKYVDHARREGGEIYFMRPYLFKQRCYQHEREVRVVFPRDPDNLGGGRLLPVDPHKLIERVHISPHIPRTEAAEIRRSILYAWRIGNQWEFNDGDPAVFVSNSTTVLQSPVDSYSLSECEATGIVNFGSLSMPFVMCGDFCSNPSEYLKSNNKKDR